MELILKLSTIIVGALIGGTVISLVLGLVGALIVTTVLGLSLLGRRDWVPLVYNVRSLGVRRWTTGVTAFGLALVVFVFTTVLMLASGVRETLKATGQPNNAKIIRKGSQTELQSGLLPENVRLLSASPEVAPGLDGKPLVSPEIVVLIFAVKAHGAGEEDGTNVNVRGVGPGALELHPPKHLEGRMFRPGTSEIVIGKGLQGRFRGMQLGDRTRFARRDWTVVGVMDCGGSAYDSEVWGDVDQFMDAFARRPSVSSLTMRLKDPKLLSALQARLESDPNLSTLEAKSEVDYWAAQSEQFSLFVRFLGVFVAVMFSVGAALGAMITMYAQVAARTREIGTLRALGFRRRAVLVSFVAESVILGLIAGVIGVASASAMQLATFTTMNFQTFSEVSFRFHMSGGIVAAAIGFAFTMGFAGGFLPARRAAMLPIVRATRGG
ncbi:MAG TPA: ABC transporter permease [Polyangia bacterium]|jgi:ABC-type lipoprotein release transport system permease subunit|nr:ABC transporter permease [Polyangia bacterium]